MALVLDGGIRIKPHQIMVLMDDELSGFVRPEGVDPTDVQHHIYIQHDDRLPKTTGVVALVGDKAHVRLGYPVEPGDVVVAEKHAGSTIVIEEVTYHVFHADDILGVIEDAYDIGDPT